MNPMTLDLVIVLFLIIYTIMGYIRGFIIRLYDFFTLFFSLFLAFNFSMPLSKLWTLYSLEGLLAPLGEKMNQILIFVIIFFITKFLFQLLGTLLKPFLKKIVSLLKMTRFFDGLLGSILSIIQGVILVYLALSMIFVPFIKDSKKTIQESRVASFIMETMPDYYSSFIEYDQLDQLTSFDLSLPNEKQAEIVTDFIEQADQNQWLEKETIKQFIQDYYSELAKDDLSKEDYQKLQDLCQNYQIDIKSILKGE